MSPMTSRKNRNIVLCKEQSRLTGPDIAVFVFWESVTKEGHVMKIRHFYRLSDVLRLRRLAHAGFLSDTRYCLTVTTNSVSSQSYKSDRLVFDSGSLPWKRTLCKCTNCADNPSDFKPAGEPSELCDCLRLQFLPRAFIWWVPFPFCSRKQLKLLTWLFSSIIVIIII